MDNEVAVGRIWRATGGPRGDGYAWFIYGSSRQGVPPTRDQAAADWKVTYEREKRHGH